MIVRRHRKLKTALSMLKLVFSLSLTNMTIKREKYVSLLKQDAKD